MIRGCNDDDAPKAHFFGDSSPYFILVHETSVSKCDEIGGQFQTRDFSGIPALKGSFSRSMQIRLDPDNGIYVRVTLYLHAAAGDEEAISRPLNTSDSNPGDSNLSFPASRH